jgi:type I restriction-modification system DNA methylase subunit
MAIALDREIRRTLERAVRRARLAKATDLMGRRYTLVATNVPYLGRGRQSINIQKHLERFYPYAKQDLATACLQRCTDFAGEHGTAAAVSTQNWFYLTSYTHYRRNLLANQLWNLVASVGSNAFETISGEVVNVALWIASRSTAKEASFGAIIVGEQRSTLEKSEALRLSAVESIRQSDQFDNPDSRITLSKTSKQELLSAKANSSHGQGSFDSLRFSARFWELARIEDAWVPQQSTPEITSLYGGCHFVFR